MSYGNQEYRFNMHLLLAFVKQMRVTESTSKSRAHAVPFCTHEKESGQNGSTSCPGDTCISQLM